MSLKLKVFSLGVLAVVAASALAVVNAGAVTPPGSHFLSHSAEHHLVIKGTDGFGTGHAMKFRGESGEAITCTHSTYHGTLTGSAATTTQAFQVRPHYTKCATEGGSWGSVTIHVPAACGTNVIEFTSGNPGTVHVNCQITITHPNCTIRVPVQTSSGATYTPFAESNASALTIDVSGQEELTSHYEAGICVFLGTAHKHKLEGQATFWGEHTSGSRVGITHT
ncbi:MAG TPA: hypothetical protein VEQ41_09975 [Solirubrobacterales bacterium]|nr:hypothetical protein [Solirubrobacterales bacterium]